MKQKPEILPLGQQHGDEGGTPERNEYEIGEYADKMDEVRGERIRERDFIFEDVGHGGEKRE